MTDEESLALHFAQNLTKELQEDLHLMLCDRMDIDILFSRNLSRIYELLLSSIVIYEEGDEDEGTSMGKEDDIDKTLH